MRSPGAVLKRSRFVRRSRIEAPAARVFAWHLTGGALEKLIPPGEKFRVLSTTGEVGNGARVVFEVRIGPIPVTWVAEHTRFVPGREFTDVQLEGPFAIWEHRHLVEPDGPAACFLEDSIEYALPLGWLGRVVAGRLVRRRLERLFAFRHRVTEQAVLAATPE